MNAVVPSNAAKATEVINLDALVDILEASEITEKTDLGAATLYKAQHPERGNIILVNTAGDQNAIIYM